MSLHRLIRRITRARRCRLCGARGHIFKRHWLNYRGKYYCPKCVQLGWKLANGYKLRRVWSWADKN